MNIHLIKSDLERLTDADKRAVNDYCIFLHWSLSPFQKALAIFIEAEYLFLPKPSRSQWLISLRFLFCVLRGAWNYASFHGVANAWLRIAGAYRCKYKAGFGDDDTEKEPPQ